MSMTTEQMKSPVVSVFKDHDMAWGVHGVVRCGIGREKGGRVFSTPFALFCTLNQNTKSAKAFGIGFTKTEHNLSYHFPQMLSSMALLRSRGTILRVGGKHFLQIGPLKKTWAGQHLLVANLLFISCVR